MRRRGVLMGVGVGFLGLFGCSDSGPQRSDAEWNNLLVAELEPLEHVQQLDQFSYSMQGVLGRKNTAWISGVVRSDTDDEAANWALLDEVGRAIATVHQDNPVKDSWVKVHVISPSLTKYQFSDIFDHQVATLEDLAERYDVER